MEILNVGLIGFGTGGRVFHAPIITSIDGFNLKSVYTRSEANKEVLSKYYPNSNHADDMDMIFNDKDIDLIVVATPNNSHYELAKKALLQGKHVVVEKPFTVHTWQADELISLAKEKNRVLTVHQNRRWDSGYKTVKKVIESNMLGDLVEYEAHFDRFRNYIKEGSWKEIDSPGNGMLYDLGIHLIDQALHLFGLPKSVFSHLRSQRKNSNVTDNFEIILFYDKMKVTLKSSMLVREDLPRYILLGNNGSFVKYGIDVQEENLKSFKFPNDDPNWGAEPESIWGTINTESNGIHVRGTVTSENGDYRQYYRDVYESIVEGREPKVRAQEARDALRVIELAFESNEKKCIVHWN
ncbi:Gfo/Idh/MocA family oxidoreductase [Anaeromicrobium sediminis]|uniref:Oxidoreductase n=1 Tax=Anaeromicrobium sediminis TaxID=1478221 RepID=A0A267MJT1_9FIRM|nr:Gfo/Idh/MocA family oxidoreductase [Anaeromicrobium sediminis]PAB59829.1 oxidoreductase [Anaeromicrobium sediminis]